MTIEPHTRAFAGYAGGEHGLDQPQGRQRNHGLRGSHRFSQFSNLSAPGPEAIVRIFY